MISIIIPLYNKEKEIARAIKSVLSQSFSEFELIVVDDGSTDKSLAVVKTFSDKKIKILTKQNGGVSSARNLGIMEAKYDWIALLDGDDWWSADFLSTMFGLSIRYPDAGLYCCQYVQVNKQNEIIHLDRFPNLEEGYFELYNYLFAVHSSAVLMRKRVFQDYGYFDEQLTHGEDTDLWIRIGLNSKACYTSKVLSFYYLGGDPFTRSGFRTRKLEHNLLSRLDSYFNLGGEKWDNLLYELKIHGLERFYIIDPFNKQIRQMLQSIPSDILKQYGNSIFHKGPIYFIFSHIRYLLFERIKDIIRIFKGLFPNK